MNVNVTEEAIAKIVDENMTSPGESGFSMESMPPVMQDLIKNEARVMAKSVLSALGMSPVFEVPPVHREKEEVMALVNKAAEEHVAKEIEEKGIQSLIEDDDDLTDEEIGNALAEELGSLGGNVTNYGNGLIGINTPKDLPTDLNQ